MRKNIYLWPLFLELEFAVYTPDDVGGNFFRLLAFTQGMFFNMYLSISVSSKDCFWLHLPLS